MHQLGVIDMKEYTSPAVTGQEGRSFMMVATAAMLGEKKFPLAMICAADFTVSTPNPYSLAPCLEA